MSTKIQKDIVCPACGQTQKLEMYTSVNAEENPELRRDILRESMFDWECLHCGYTAQMAYPMIYHDPMNAFMICLRPSGAEGRVRLNHVVAEYPTISWVGNKVSGFIPGFSQGPAPKSKEAEIWVKALKGEGELFVTADQAYVVTRILDAIYESNRTGKPVYFD